MNSVVLVYGYSTIFRVLGYALLMLVGLAALGIDVCIRLFHSFLALDCFSCGLAYLIGTVSSSS